MHVKVTKTMNCIRNCLNIHSSDELRVLVRITISKSKTESFNDILPPKNRETVTEQVKEYPLFRGGYEGSPTIKAPIVPIKPCNRKQLLLLLVRLECCIKRKELGMHHDQP
jgi:hypothetical protein